MTISPTSWVGLAVLLIFSTCMLLIVLEAWLHMDKFKPALLMLSALPLIGIWYWASGDDPHRFDAFIEMQKENESELFSLIAFMAFMWMMVEIMAERGVFAALTGYLTRRGFGAAKMFWATGALAAVLSPFINNITTAMIFGKSIKEIARNRDYQHIALCNLIIASNSGVWFLGTATSLMIVLAGKISIAGLLLLLPASIIGWAASAGVLHFFYLRRLKGTLIETSHDHAHILPGGFGMVAIFIAAVSVAVVLNIALHISIEYAIGIGLAALGLYAWRLKHKGHTVPLLAQLQKVEWSMLLFFIGIISGVAALNHVGWLSYVSRLFEAVPFTAVNVILGAVSGVLDNVPVEAAVLMSNPPLDGSQWALNALMVGIGGSLTVIGSAAGVMVMSLDRSYGFATHFRFMPAILVNFLVSLAIWYMQFKLIN